MSASDARSSTSSRGTRRSPTRSCCARSRRCAASVARCRQCRSTARRPRTCSPRPTGRRTPRPTSLSPPRLRDHLAAHWQALRTRPGAYLSTLAAALRAGPMEPAVKARGAPVLLRGGRRLVARPAVRSASHPRRVRRSGGRRRHAGGPARRRGLDLEPRRARHRHAPDTARAAWRPRSAPPALSPCPAISAEVSSWCWWARSTGRRSRSSTVAST